MKKTKKTFLTAVALTATTLNPNLVFANTAESMSGLYGPPPAKTYETGDINMDGKIDILDYCLMLNSANSEQNDLQRYNSDINGDEKIDLYDFDALRNYLFGKMTKVVPFREEPIQPDYGPVSVNVDEGWEDD